MSWMWINILMAAAFFGAWVGVPLWLTFKHPDTGPAQASAATQMAAAPLADLDLIPDSDRVLAGVL